MNTIIKFLNNNKAAVGCLFLALFIIFPNLALAQNDQIMQGLEVIRIPLGLPDTDLRLVIANLINAAMGILGLTLLLLVLYAGLTWMTAMGDELKTKKAKDTLISAFIGLFIILTSYSLANYFFGVMQSAVQ